MARIAGVDLPNNKRLDIGLTAIFGIGRVTASKICIETKLDPAIRCKDLTEQQVALLRDYIDKNLVVEGERRKKVSLDIKALTEIRSYRGKRHIDHLPCRGQKTRTNAKTVRGIPQRRKKK